jgi:hypothetical protein
VPPGAGAEIEAVGGSSGVIVTDGVPVEAGSKLVPGGP